MCLGACQPEKRELALGQPITPPAGPGDPRAETFEANGYQLSQGGRLFTWYGCGKCHAQGAKGTLALDDLTWRYGGSIDQVFASIADGRPDGMPAYSARIPTLQLWEIAAYVRQLPKVKPGQRLRQDSDQKGEPQGDSFTGPWQ